MFLFILMPAYFLSVVINYFKVSVNEHFHDFSPNFWDLSFFHDFSRPGNNHLKIA